MNKLLFLILISSCFSVQAGISRVHVTKQSDGSFRVDTWGLNKDGSQDTVIYKSAPDLDKITPLIEASVHGLPRDSEFTEILFNTDGTLEKSVFHNLSSEKTEAPENKTIVAEMLPVKAVTDSADLKADIQVKTGKTEELPPDPPADPPGD